MDNPFVMFKIKYINEECVLPQTEFVMSVCMFVHPVYSFKFANYQSTFKGLSDVCTSGATKSKVQQKHTVTVRNVG